MTNGNAYLPQPPYRRAEREKKRKGTTSTTGIAENAREIIAIRGGPLGGASTWRVRCPSKEGGGGRDCGKEWEELPEPASKGKGSGTL